MQRPVQSALLFVLVACGGGAATTNPPVVQNPPATGATANVAPGQTQMLSDLQTIGIDITKDTDLAALDIDKKKKVMKLFVKSLGTDCGECHADDFKEDTVNKRIARHMWSDFVAKLRDAQGNPIFCDTCHQGKAKIINRDDDKVLAGFMKANYVEKMQRADKAEHKCATCHGEPFQPDIFKNVFHAEK